MARPLRIEFPGALYHLISRGNERREIAHDDHDRQTRLQWLQRTVQSYDWRLHAFVLMTNHEHLFVETPQANLSAGMQFLNGSYTSYFNRRHRRAGHLFQGRFKGHLIEEEGHFLEVSRYLHLNPVRAKMVRRPEDYRWGSYPGYHRARQALQWVTYDRVLGEFDARGQNRRRLYAQFVRAGMTDAPPSPLAGAAGGLLVGSQAFVDRIRRLLKDRPATASLPELKRLRGRPSLRQILYAVSEHFGGDADTWSGGRRSDDASRAVAAYVARSGFGYPATTVAAALGYRGPSSVSHAVRRIENGPESLRAVALALIKDLE
jgi:REP element-mobilizing transposase RayT